MRTRCPTAAVVCVLALVAAGCGGPTKAAVSAHSVPSVDVNPVPRDKVPSGGTLRWALDQFPDNFNITELDGNSVDANLVMGALMPGMFLSDAQGLLTPDPDYLLSATLTSRTPKEVVTYELNPKARWDDGKPIDEADFEAEWKALRGTNPAYQIVSSSGYEDIGSVKPGANDREVVVTFARPYADWQKLFGVLYPAATDNDPKVFNEGWQNRPLVTAGPFRFAGADQTAKTITLVRNDNWWGNRAKLDRIIFRVIDPDAQIDALLNGEIDFIEIAADINKYQRAQGVSGLTIRRAVSPDYRHFDFNGDSPTVGDVRVRRAIALAIDRATIARIELGPLGLPPVPLQNHILMENQAGYQNNAGALATPNLPAARRLLDEAGWVSHGRYRRKDGRQLDVRFVIPSGVLTSTQEAEIVQTMLEPIGVKVIVQTVPVQLFFRQYINPVNFDMTAYSWGGSLFPVSDSKSIYQGPVVGPDGKPDFEQNHTRISSPQIDALYARADSEFDPVKVRELGNQIDALIWDEVHSVTVYQRPSLIAARSKLANFGAFGLLSIRYEDVGFTK